MSEYNYKFARVSHNAGAQKGSVPKSDYVDLFQHTLDEQFYNSSNWWTIEEETALGSKEYQNVDVRIAHLINTETGLKLGDDWKTLLFSSIEHPVELGKHYRFSDNIWLTVNMEVEKNLTSTCTIRRCNNTMRWIDEPTGIYYEEPCCIEPLVKEPRNYATQGSPFITPGGFLHIEMQLNERSARIKQNQRFLFGNPTHWTCYKIVGTGINDFKNTKTFDNESAKILTLDLVADFLSPELDDIVNGIADANTNLYTLSLNQDSVTGTVGDTLQLIPYITYNGHSSTRDVVWSTSSPNVATVSSTGLVSFVSSGCCSITARIDGNPSYDTCDITVSSTPILVDEIRISPETNYVLEGANREYSVYRYVNNVQQADTFDFICSGSSVPSENYIFSQTSGNKFKVTNIKRCDTAYLTITCTTSDLEKSRAFSVRLLGAWQHGNK